MLTEKMIPSSQVTRVSDMRILPALDDDSILLVVKDGKCWKMPVKTLKGNILTTVIDNVSKLTDHVQNDVLANIDNNNKAIKEIGFTVKTCSNELALVKSNTNNKLDNTKTVLSLALENTNIKITETNDNLTKLSIDINALIRQLNLSAIKTDFTTFLTQLQQQYTTVKDLYNQLSLASKQLSTNILRKTTAITNINKQQEQIKTDISSILDSIRQFNSNLSNNVVLQKQQISNIYEKISAIHEDIDKNLNLKFFGYNASLSSISSAISSTNLSIATNFTVTTRKIDEISSSIDNNLSSISYLVDKVETLSNDIANANSSIANISANTYNLKAEELEAKLYGINIKLIDETGKDTIEQVSIGDITKIMLMLKELSSKVEAISNELN